MSFFSIHEKFTIDFFLKWFHLWFVEEERDDGTGQDKLLDK